MKRRIVQIHEELCNGCELCVNACHEGAIEMVDGKAKLVSDVYCDGLGDCLPACPTGAIEIIERDADEYDQEAVDQRLKDLGRPPMDAPAGHVGHGHGHEGHGHGHHHHDGQPCGCEGKGMEMMQKLQMHSGGGCPGSKAMSIQQQEKAKQVQETPEAVTEVPAKLTTWPVQINLVSPQAPYLQGSDLLIAADCTAFAYGNFHKDFIEGRVCLIGCPKLDDNQFYAEKLTTILSQNDISSITVVRMEVPCCSGIVQSVKQAMLQSGKIVKYNEVTIGLNGGIK